MSLSILLAISIPPLDTGEKMDIAQLLSSCYYQRALRNDKALKNVQFVEEFTAMIILLNRGFMKIRSIIHIYPLFYLV